MVEPTGLILGGTVVLLALIWGSAFHFADRERVRARAATAQMLPELADTYEARILRALRQVDSTLKLVRHSLASTGPERVLENLRHDDLLPLEFIFTVSIADAEGRIQASTNPRAVEDISGRPVLRSMRSTDDMIIGHPRFSQRLDEWRLTFARGWRDGSGFAGAVLVSVPAAYFVSGYEDRSLGQHGVLGLLGTDGEFRVLRSGDQVSAGQTVDYGAIVPRRVGSNAGLEARVSPWDGIPRYLVARKLYGYPLAIVAGVSRAERMAPVAEVRNSYFRRAGAASALVIALMFLLGRLSSQLHKARLQVLHEQTERAREVEYLAFHDALTELPNRAFFSQLLFQEIQKASRYGKRFALLFLDLDGFKNINDSLGHSAGDALLQELARRTRDALRESDIVARLGGDEFVVLLPEVQDPGQMAVVADKLLTAVARPFIMNGQRYRVSVSIGIALYPDDATNESDLMTCADLAMYHAKERGKDNFQYYADELNTDTLERLALESSLRSALDRDEFRLFYQAKHDLGTGEVVGTEALLRWQHPEYGLTEPMQFIPEAEGNGLILPIGRWVLHTACRQNVEWQRQGYPALTMAVNLSARQFLDENLLTDIQEALEASGMAPGLLEVEITENMVLPDIPRSIEILNRLKALGVRVAIDDFGTGYSSLTSIRDFPLDTIKIDHSFIENLITNPEDQQLTDAIISVGRNLSYTVIAEGVESSEQAAFLREHECNQFQGFYSGEPVPAEEFARQFVSGEEASNG
jgi:diguanylate cyclase (GGDEF)-like protein